MRIGVSRGFGIVAGMLLLAAALGGSLGLVAAKDRDNAFPNGLVVGQNYTGPVGGTAPVTPTNWLSCLPATSWSAVYTWDGRPAADGGQQWYHFFNPAKGVPAYVNLPEVGGITTIPQLAGVALLMDEAVPKAETFFKDKPGEVCP